MFVCLMYQSSNFYGHDDGLCHRDGAHYRGGDGVRHHRGGDVVRHDRGGDAVCRDRGGDAVRHDRGGDAVRHDRGGDHFHRDHDCDGDDVILLTLPPHVDLQKSN